MLYSPSENRYSFYNKALSEQEASPYSTFKIVSALMGLHNDIITDETSTMNYNGTEYPNPEWNGNLTFQEAFQTSCIWYFRQIIDAVGEDEAEKELSELEYGNCDISKWEGSNINPYQELNGFWLNASLKISPLEQVAVLSKIFEGKSIYDRQDIEILKKVMLTQDNGTQQIYGKTGSGSDGEAWFVGFIETAEQRRYFAVYLNDVSQEEQISGSTAKEIALKILE
ncbi:penicillin-binding transpeptidase domain-containing protein [Blautia marasmi]|uniref:penicillin-binding transpeptidase domain-containing protein n=1 Tax=Blautia marasmi TaxID=1917868 RepID=UPI001FA86172|nr:penicillin-binding transpeptidase domain-containing protein [Blautia marasmi]